MKPILLLLLAATLCSLTAQAQRTDTSFEKRWALVDSLIIKKSLPKSALQQVNAIYADAQKQHNAPQVVRALAYKISLENNVDDKSINQQAAPLQNQLQQANSPVEKSLLQVLQAQLYQQYFNQHRWQLRQRSNTVNVAKTDIATWNETDFYQAISHLYTAALQPANALQRTGLKEVAPVIAKGNASYLRPTLYDLLAHTAIQFYQSFAGSSTQATTWQDAATLAPVTGFLQHRFTIADTTAAQKTALLYQDVLRFHQADASPAAFIDADIARIEWAYQHYYGADKNDLYLAALTAVTQTYPAEPTTKQAWFLLAQQLVNDAHYTPLKDTANRYNLVKAKALAEQHIDRNDTLNEGNTHLMQLVQNILQKSLSTQVEEVTMPHAPFRALVQYRNIDTVFGRLIRLDNQLNGPTYINYEDWNKYTSMPAVAAFTQALPNPGDYQKHSAEIKINALPAGRYMLLTSNRPSFNNLTDNLAAQFFTVSVLSYIQNGNDYFVLNRESGEPLPNVTAQFYTQYWKGNRYLTETAGSKKTDANGFFQASNISSPGRQPGMMLINGKDTLNAGFMPSIVFTNELTAGRSEKDNATIYFFTDRSIYRPGQTLYFKGLVLTKEGNQPVCYQSKDSIKIFLEDANDKTIDSAAFVVNNYGSFAGKFRLPSATLNGQFSLYAKDINGRSSFRVEEYKRPTFYIDFDTLQTTYRLNDTIHVKGQVKAYAGNTINAARLSFTVNRSAHFPYPWLFYSSFRPASNRVQVKADSLVTDANGRFDIAFPALPDISLNKSTNPVFDFNVQATVTDNNGETRTGERNVSVSYHPLVLKVTAPAVTSIDSFKQVNIAANNLAGKKTPVTVQVRCYPLQAPQRLTRQRLWEQPDQFVIDSASFVRDFPYDVYNEPTDYHNWPQQSPVISDTFTTSRSAFAIPAGKLSPGYYAIAASVVLQGDTIKDISYVQLYQPGSNSLPVPQYQWSGRPATGNAASLLVGSSAKAVNLIVCERQQGKSNQYHFKQLNAGIDSIRAGKANNTGLFYAFVKHSRFYTGGSSFTAPNDDKELDISYQSFRNKTEPGSKEQFTLRISGSKGEKVAAELLTGMYDASLDQFVAHKWTLPDVWEQEALLNQWNQGNGFRAAMSNGNWPATTRLPNYFKQYDQLLTGNVLGNRYGTENYLEGTFAGAANDVVVVGYGAVKRKNVAAAIPAPEAAISIRGNSAQGAAKPLYVIDGAVTENMDLGADDIASTTVLKNEEATALYGSRAANGVIVITTKGGQQQQPVQVRKDFNETAFFFPQLYADTAGNYSFSFTMPDAVTQWKWMSFAHTRQLATGYSEQTITSQKTLMVQPNLPRFVRNGDQLELSAKISNLGSQELSGQASLQLIDPTTNQPVDGLFHNVFPDQYFTVAAGQSSSIKFPVAIPYNYNQPVTLRIIAKAGNYSDGEEHALAVLSNRTLVTETLPLLVKGNTTRHFSFDKLLHNESETLTQQGLTVEFSSNPIWYAIQALPYLMEYPHECAEQTFNRLYANLVAGNIVQQHPAIQTLFNEWKKDSTALLSNLQKNTELKQLVLQETPWVLDAENETRQRKNIALLFDFAKMNQGTETAIAQLKQMQLPSGAFPWFKSGPEDMYITNYILTGIGKLKALHALGSAANSQLTGLVKNAIEWLDDYMMRQYKEAKKYEKTPGLSAYSLQYLYMRSFFTDISFNDKTAYSYYYNEAKKQWAQQNTYEKAMTGFVCLRNNDQSFALTQVLPSVLENAVEDSSKGMYWKERTTCFWYPSPIEHQSMLLSFVQEANKQKPSAKLAHAIMQMQTWLLLNKQTNNWKTTTATADACYVLLNDAPIGTSVASVNIQLGNEPISNNATQGYIKQHFPAQKITPAMGDITVTVSGNAGKPAWGAVYWQYFENNEKVTEASSPLSVNRKLFVEKPGASGPVLTPVNDGDELKPGDKVKIRMEIRSDRDLEYVHLKDARGAAFEPANVLSGYRWQDALGYYETTHDASTDFFFSRLKKGTYVFEYPAFVTHTGSFTAGITTIQCMYAPEFNAHSSGLKITVTEK